MSSYTSSTVNGLRSWELWWYEWFVVAVLKVNYGVNVDVVVMMICGGGFGEL